MIEVLRTPEFVAWLDGLQDRQSRAVVARRLLRVASGLAGDVQPVGRGLSELRIHHGPGYRVYIRWLGPEKILILFGGDKSTQACDIQTAHRLAKEAN